MGDEATIAKIRAGGGSVLPRLRAAGVSEAVIEAWLEAPSEPVATAEADAAPEASGGAAEPAGSTDKAPAHLPITMHYEAGKSAFDLVNTGDGNLTGVTVTLNGEYRYKLPVPLKPEKADSIKLASHRSTKSGDRMHDPAAPPFIKAAVITKIVVTSDQGTWSKAF